MKQLFKEDDVVLVGQAVAIIDTNADSTQIDEKPAAKVEVEPSEDAYQIERMKKQLKQLRIPNHQIQINFSLL